MSNNLDEFVCQDFRPEAAAGQEMSLPGDYYREHDNFTRGIAMSPALAGGMSSEACTGSFRSDYEKFFVEPGDELRGISIGSEGGIGMTFFGSDMRSGHPGFDDQLGHLGPFKAQCASRCQAPNILKPAVPFTEEHCPPEKPKDKYFRLEVTHTVVASERPHEIGNAMLDFFANTVTASLTKVRHAKFAIKADVFVGSVMCTVKARVYEAEAGRYAVELQRRSGDALAYSSTWKQARSYLQSRVSKGPAEVDESHQSADNGQGIFPAPADFPLEVGRLNLAPIHDMASFSEMPSIQAEAATALLGLAGGSSKESCDFLATEKMFETIDKLVQSDGKEVGYPTAKLLLVLLQRVELLSPEKPEVLRSFARLIFPSVLKKVAAKQTSELVQQSLLEVVYAVVDVCVRVPAKQVQEVEEALRRQVMGGDAEPCIQEALAKALLQLEAA